MFGNQGDFFVRIGSIPVEGNDHFLTETFHIGHMLVEVGKAVAQTFDVLFLDL